MAGDLSEIGAAGPGPVEGSAPDPPEAATMEGVSVEAPGPSPRARHPAIRYDLRVLQALRRIIRAIDLHSRKLLAQHDITSPQLVCLLAVGEHRPVTPSAIARHVHLSPSTVIGILDRLECKGLVRRARDLKDRRLVQVWLTEQGEGLVERAPSPLQDTLAKAMNELPDAELATIAGSLERIVELMEVRNIDAAPILETGPITPGTGEPKRVETGRGAEPDARAAAAP